MKKLFLLLFVVGLTCLTMYRPEVLDVFSRQSAVLEIGNRAPEFALTGLDQNTYQLAGPRDKPLVLNFWASWCGPCQGEAPHLRELYLQHKQDLDFYAINVTSDDHLADAKKFVEQFKLPFPIPLDEQGEVAKLYQVRAYPTTFLIDRQGKIHQRIIGMIDPQTFEKELQELIALP
ncbi:TlpA family protein disulfide reductase [Brevibacillus fulvus]|uniref:Peroxiredoxin n=1 Tax=Brevibacillus fulvus TaxID=1125967 RepID=A0A938XYA2_9BACL|nr:TlpA disulfide reductase family protein [Brevibacillus fulvus]MBM7590409.1 peroxiredoxin [Brevibacillus fulvus]